MHMDRDSDLHPDEQPHYNLEPIPSPDFEPEPQPEPEQWDEAYDWQLSEEAIDADRGTVSFYALPLAFFFRPSRFMRSFGFHISGGLLFSIIWMTGISLVLLRFEQSISFGTSSRWFPESWLEITIIAVLGGLFRGGVVYGLGGLWYRLRLAMCGVHDVWEKTGRVYMSAGIAKHLFSITTVAIAATQHDTFIDYVQNQPAVAAMIVGGLLVLFEIWSSFTLYFGTRSVFPAKKLWAIVWFLVLPIATRLLGLIILLGVIFFTGYAAEPQLNQPTKYAGESFRFGYPSNWFITRDQEVPGPETWIQIEPMVGDALFEFAIRNIEPGEDMVTDYRKYYEQNAGLIITGTPKPIEKQGRFDGYGFEYHAELENKEFLFRLFEIEIEEGTRMLITVLSEEKSWDTLKPGYDWIISTLKVTKPSEIRTDLSSTYTVRKDPVEFEIPRNWWIDISQADDFENEDGSTSRGQISLFAQPPGWGYFRVMIYESELSPRAELGITIDEYSTNSRLIDEQPIDAWLGLEGFGATGKIQYEDGALGLVKIIIAPLDDGRLIELRHLVPEDVDDFYASGFDLIESTFKLRVDPAPTEP